MGMMKQNKTNWWKVATIVLAILTLILLLNEVNNQGAQVLLGGSEGFYVDQAFLQTAINEAITLGWNNLTITEISTNKSVTIQL